MAGTKSPRAMDYQNLQLKVYNMLVQEQKGPVKYKTYMISWPNGKNRKVKGLLFEQVVQGVQGVKTVLKGTVVCAHVCNEILTCEEIIDITGATVTIRS